MLHFGLHFYLCYAAISISLIISGWSLLSKHNKIQRDMDAGKHYLLPQLLNLMTLFLGILYGLPMISDGSLLALFISTVQAILLVRFIIKLIEVSGPERRRRHQVFLNFIFIGIASVVILVILLMEIENHLRRHYLGGLLFNLSTIVASLSVYQDMKLAWTTRSVEHMSVFWTMATIFNAISWIVFGSVPFDRFTLLPNVYGLIVAVVQLITYALFRNSDVLRRKASQECHLQCIETDHPQRYGSSTRNTTEQRRKRSYSILGCITDVLMYWVIG